MKLSILLTTVFFFSFFQTCLQAGGLFEEAFDTEPEITGAPENFEMSGFVKGSFHVWDEYDSDAAELKSGYGEISLKLEAGIKDFGGCFSDLRFRKGHEYGGELEEITTRETYIDIYAGSFDFRIGQQIVVWGRADGFNPTSNITPVNIMKKSADFDDTRMGNTLVRAWFNMSAFSLESIWIPVYRSSIPPLEYIDMSGEGVTFRETGVYPCHRLDKSGFALRADLRLPRIGCSVSYFDGYNLTPGLDADILLTGLEFIPTAYRVRILGADYAFAAGSFGLTGEAAYKETYEDHTTAAYLPNPEIYYVLGIDRTIDDFFLLGQYIGRYVFEFEELSEPGSIFELPAYEIALANRLFLLQHDRISHSASAGFSLDLLHQTLKLEFTGVYNFSTEEYILRPLVSYSLADAFTLSAGATYFDGPAETLYDMTRDLFSSVFIEVKYSF